MNAKDLMIGNLVYHHDEIITIKSLHPGDDDVNDEIPFHAIFGIPITEYLLVIKLGFKKKSQGQFYISRKEELGHQFGDFSISIYDDTQIKVWRGNRYIGVVHCEFIHHIQNLYFALTQSELKIL